MVVKWGGGSFLVGERGQEAFEGPRGGGPIVVKIDRSLISSRRHEERVGEFEFEDPYLNLDKVVNL